MASYMRFDIFLPVHYSVTVHDPRTGKDKIIYRGLRPGLVSSFIRDCSSKFSGVTQTFPTNGPAYKGLWYDQQKGIFDVDHLTHLFVLVKIHDEDVALQFFDGWKKKLARGTHQKVILIIYSPVQTSGDFF